VFLAFIGGSLLLVSTLTGKEVALKRLNAWVPWIWTLGIMVFSTGLFVGGIMGEPRRTNMGLSYTNPSSPLYQPAWTFAKRVGTVGGVVMFTTLLRKRTMAPALDLPSSEPLHDENVPAVQNLRPWLVAAVILLIVAYTIPFVELARGKYEGAPPYTPSGLAATVR
jgi:cytochrome c oxidase subunit 1